MSLIQEALHRRNAELGKPMLAPVSPAPPPLPPPPPASAPQRGRKPAFGKIIFLVVLLLALLGYGGWHFFLRPPEQPTPVAVKPPTTTHQPAKVISAPSVTNILAQAKAKLETTITPERTELVKGATNVAIATPAPAVPPQTNVVVKSIPAVTNMPPAALTSEPSAVVTTPPVAAPTPKPAPTPVRWPKLNITGIMGRSGGDCVAFINGQILKAGDSIAEARILIIAESSVQLVFQGETNTIRVGKGSE